MTAPGGLGEGVYFAREAYAGLLRRFLIIAIDVGVLVLAGFLLGVVWFALLPARVNPSAGFGWSWLAVTYVYLTIIEASQLGTLGFLLTGVKIVNLKGERPSIVRMTFRLCLCVFGPFNAFVDLLWLGGDDQRQTLRDKLAGTYVVKKQAVPAGQGVVGLAYYYLLGYALMVPEVKKGGPLTGP